MNAFPSQRGECRIIVPTVSYEDYLLALKVLSHQGDATAYVRAMTIAQVWASQLRYDVDAPTMNCQLDACDAKK